MPYIENFIIDLWLILVNSMVLDSIIIATLLVSLVSLVGVFVLSLKHKTMHALLFVLMSFATGTLFGSAFLDLIPESLEKIDAHNALFTVLAGLIIFFIVEKLIYWHHHHHSSHEEKEKPFAYLNLIGDGIHNFFDGAAIAASFMAGPELGVTTTIAIIAHEIPQEIGDFSLLIYSGFTRKKALLFNLLSALIAIFGALIFFYFSSFVENLEGLGLAFTAGMFIYIAAADLMPELQKELNVRKSVIQLVSMLIGIIFILGVVVYLE